MPESSLNWDDLSDTPPLPSVGNSEDPQADAIIARMNAGVASGKSEDEILSQEVGDFGRVGREATAASEKKSLSWDDLLDKPPEPTVHAKSDIDEQQLLYNAPNYAPTIASPIDRNATAPVTSTDAADAPGQTLTPLAQQARALDASQAPPEDNRREVGFGEAAWRTANQGAAQTESLLSGAVGAVGYPITAADAAISGRPVPSFTEAVSKAQAPTHAVADQYAIKPETEKLGLAGEVGAGIGGAGEQLLEMVGTGPGKAVEETATLSTQLAQKLVQTARVSSVPAAKAAKEAAQQTIDEGGSPLDAANAAAGAYQSNVASTVLPMAARGSLATRAASGGAIGAGLSAVQGGNTQQIVAGAVTGASLGGAMGEPGAPPAERAATRARDLADQLTPHESALLNQGAKMGESASDNTGVTDILREAEHATESGQVPESDLAEHQGNGEVGTPSESGNRGGAEEGAQKEVDKELQDFSFEHAGKRYAELSNKDELTPEEHSELRFLNSNPDHNAIIDAYGIEKNGNQDTGRSAGEGAQTEEAKKEQEVAHYSREPGVELNEDADAWHLSQGDLKNTPVDGYDPLVAGFQLLSQHDTAHTLPMSRQRGLDGIVADNDGRYGWNVKPSPELAAKNAQKPDKAWEITTPNGSKGAIYEKGNKVWIDVSDLKAGDDGKRVYNDIGNYTHNNPGKVFIGDPAGLSATGQARRLENMFNLGLKYRTTDNLAPHEMQLSQRGGTETPALAWKPGDHTFNLRALAHASHEATLRQFPEIREIKYDPARDEFVRRDNGEVVTQHDLEQLAAAKRQAPSSREELEARERANTPRTITAGSRSIGRGVLADTLLRATPEERSALLAKLRGFGDRSAAGVVEGRNQAADGHGLSGVPESAPVKRSPLQSLLYSRTEGPAHAGLSASEAKQALSKAFGRAGANKLARKITFVSRNDLAPHTPELNDKQRAGVKGFTSADKSTAAIVHDNLSESELPGIVVHEIYHANADRILSETQRNSLASAVDRIAAKNADVKAALDNIPRSTPKGHIAEEKVAYALQHLQNQPVGRRALDTIKLGLNRLGVPLDWLNAHEAALREIGQQNVHHYAETGAREPVNGAAAYAADGGEKYTVRGFQKPRYRVPVDQVPTQRIPNEGTNIPNPVGVKNDAKAQEREARNLDPVEVEGKRDFGSVWDKATAQRERDPNAGTRLASEISAKPRALNAEETALLTQYGADLNNRYDAVLSDIEAAQKSGDRNAEVNAQMRRKEVEGLLATHDIAARQSGYEQGLGLAMRRAMANRDYSMARQVMRFRAIEGGEIPAFVKQRIEAQVKEIADLRKQLDERQAGKVKRAPVGNTKAIADEFDSLKAELAKISKLPESSPQYARAEPEVASIIRRMAENRNKAGVDGEEMVRQIHEAVKDHADVSPRDVRDAISGYGKERKQTKDELQQRFNALKSELRKVSKSEDIASGKLDPNEQKNAVRQKQIVRDLVDIKSRIQRGDFEKKKRPAPVYDEKTYELQGQLNAARNRLDQLAKQRERAQSGVVAKTADFITNMHMMDILSSLAVYPKLASAVVFQHGSDIAQAIAASGLKHVPGLKRIYQQANRHGAGFSIRGDVIERGKGIGAGLKGAKEQLLHGQSQIESKFSTPHMSGEFTDYMGQMADAVGIREKVRVAMGYVGRTHAAVKEFVTQPEFRKSYFLHSEGMKRQLVREGKTPEQVDEFMARESTKALIGAHAIADAYEAKMQGKNAAVDTVNHAVQFLERQGMGGQIASFIFKNVFPIRGVPMNIAKEITSYGLGVIKAAVAARHGMRDLTPERAEYIAKNLNKQIVGLGLVALGYLAGPSVLGGVSMPGEKKKGLAVKPEEADIGGTKISNAAFHGAPAMMLQIGAGMRRVFESDYGHSNDAVDAGLHAIFNQFGGALAITVPYTNTILHDINTYEHGNEPWMKDKRGMSQVLGDQIRGMVVPQVVQQQASGRAGILQVPSLADPYTGFRHPRNIKEDIELGIPGLRENVPTH